VLNEILTDLFPPLYPLYRAMKKSNTLSWYCFIKVNRFERAIQRQEGQSALQDAHLIGAIPGMTKDQAAVQGGDKCPGWVDQTDAASIPGNHNGGDAFDF